MTGWVARTLSTNGEVFLIDCFGHDEVLARSTNHRLVLGFWHFFNMHAIAKFGRKVGRWVRENKDGVPALLDKA